MADMETDFAGILGGEDYDLYNLAAPHTLEMQAKVGRIAAKFISEIKNPQVLEIGTGSGDTSAELLLNNPGVPIVSIDIEEKMIEAARERFAHEPNLHLIHAEALSYLEEQEGDSLDVVVSSLCLHNLQSDFRREVNREIARVLKTGGMFLNLDNYVLDDTNAHVDSLFSQIKAFDVYLKPEINRPDVRDEWIRHYIADDQPGTRITENEQREILNDLGFKEIQFTDRVLMAVIMRSVK